MDALSSYRHINAIGIVQANVNTNQVGPDLADLIKVLTPLHIALKSSWSPGSTLRRDIKEKLSSKSHALALLAKVGFEDDGRGNYVFREARTDREKQDRKDATDEIGKLYRYLAEKNTGNLVNFGNALRTSLTNSQPAINTIYTIDGASLANTQQIPSTLSQRSSWHESTLNASLPNVSRVKEGNERTLKVVEAIKHGFTPSAAFTRRKIALVQLRHQFTTTMVDDSLLDQMIDQIKAKPTHRAVSLDDDVYVECLIRSEFNLDRALNLVNAHRPTLTPPPIPIVSRDGKTASSMDQSITALTQRWEALQEIRDDFNLVPHLSEEANNWKSIKHLVRAIIQLRTTNQNQNVDDVLLPKMHRLLFSELSHRIDRLMEIKVETIAGIFCNLPMDDLENLDVATIRSLCGLPFDGYFVDNAIQLFSNVCPICSGSFPRSQMETMFLCRHMCCLNCLKNYYRSQIRRIEDARSLNQLTCFQEAHEITLDARLNFFQYLESKLNQWFSDESNILELYHNKLFHATRDKRIRKCGNPQCISSFDTDGNNQRMRINCPHCHFAQCQECGQKWTEHHGDLTCAEYLTWLEKEDPENPDVQARQYLRSTMIVCPRQGCSNIFQYERGGCEHFQCTACQTNFCRLCSTVFVNPAANVECSRPNCPITSLHAHCRPNCFREVRDARPEDFIRVLEEHDIDIAEDFDNKPIALNGRCPVEGCERESSESCQHRFCEICYKEFLWSYVWNNEIEPWDLYDGNNLVVILNKSSIEIPPNATKEQLIELAQANLNQNLGKPRT